jgi:phospholipid N-methyltransferase
MSRVGKKKAKGRGRVLLFFRNFLKHPRMTGSVIPSSRFLIRHVLDQIDWQRARVLVEYGPGVGNFTAAMLERMHPDATLIVFETNPDFVKYLGDTFSDPRLQIVATSAHEVADVLRSRGFAHADYIISGVPFSTMEPELRENILRTTHAVLHPDGAFLLYQYSTWLLSDLTRIFPRVDRTWQPLNNPPACIFSCAAGVREHASARR